MQMFNCMFIKTNTQTLQTVVMIPFLLSVLWKCANEVQQEVTDVPAATSATNGEDEIYTEQQAL